MYSPSGVLLDSRKQDAGQRFSSHFQFAFHIAEVTFGRSTNGREAQRSDFSGNRGQI
jgi:hypothetical protein